MPESAIQQRFSAWLARHPEAEILYVRFARELQAKGFLTYGIGAITERIRWHYHVDADEREDFKISNSFRSRMSRHVEDKYPELRGFFTKKPLREQGATQ